MKILILAIVSVALQLSSAHVRLTWPPARYPDYDFLDNVRTGGPCGVPSLGDDDEEGPFTTLKSGSVVDVSYHLAYPHRGGIRVNLLAKNGTILYALLGLDNWHMDDNTTGFNQEVKLPDDFECEHCVLQLVRQAAEWVARGGYLFWSCSDVTIVNTTDSECDESMCSDNGNCVDGACVCDRLYYGEFCQFKDECEDASDCNNQGTCVDHGGVSLPRKQCFCKAGYFGEKCEKVSPLTDATITESDYTLRRVLSDRLTMYSKIVGDELEIALSHNGIGYVAIGWKPRGLTAGCRALSPGFFPVGTHSLWPNGRTWPMVDGADTYYRDVVLDGDVEMGSGAAEEGGEEEGGEEEGGNEEGGNEEGGNEEGGQEEGGYEEGGNEEGGHEEGGQEEGGHEEGGHEEGGYEEGGNEEGGQEEGGNEEGGHEEGGQEEGGHEEGGHEEGGHEEGGNEEGGNEEGGQEEGGQEEGGEEEGGEEEGGEEEGGEEEGEWGSGYEEGGDEEGGNEEGGNEEGGNEEGGNEEGGNEEGGNEEGGEEEGPTRETTHPMDCTDIVIGMARGETFRLHDYYTRDRSTPRMDSFYGGEDSLTAAVGMEDESGMTYLKFRRPLDTGSTNSDHVIDGLMVVIWSFGQVYPDYNHWPASGIESGTAQNDRFYQPDELKYHGSRNRGGTTINFADKDQDFDSSACTGQFNTSCDAQGVCEYNAIWTVQGEFVDFQVSARVGLSEWVAIGFSDDTFMPNTDAVVGAVDDNGFFVTDRYITARAPPPVDEEQDIKEVSAKHDNGITTMKFRRVRASKDLSLDECRFFIFGWGGSANIGDRSIGYHPSIPIVSTDRICLPSPAQCPENKDDKGKDVEVGGVDGAMMTTVSIATVTLFTLVSWTLLP